MQIVLLSGGSGKRLWPLSNEVRSKQFIKVFKTEDGNYESMVQRVYRGIKKAAGSAGITVAIGKSQASQLLNQLGESVNICVEPVRRDTFPAIVLAAAYLKDELKVSDDEPVVICPIDPYVNDDYFETIGTIAETVSTSDANMVLMGIKPTYPSEKYGYIVTGSDNRVKEFKEKPDLETAKALLAAGARWNGGIFGFKLGYILNIAHERIDFKGFKDLQAGYDKLEKISFDYAVAEKEKNILMVPFDGEWKDLGTWNMLTEAMCQNVIGPAMLDDTCENTHVLNELDIPVLGMGLKNLVVAVGPDGVLVADKGQSSYMKSFVEQIVGPVKYAEKSWGSYRVMDVSEESMTVKVTLLPGHLMNYHSHERRDEIWNILDGKGRVVIDGDEREVVAGDVISIPRGTKHTVKAVTTLNIMEIQIGKDIDVSDKIKYNLE